jgi:hypothetical protein
MKAASRRQDRWLRVLGAVTDPRRPVVFGVAFWLLLVTNVVVETLHYGDTRHRFSLWTVLAVSGAQAAAWLVLPWDETARLRRRLGVPAFLVAGLAATWVSDYGVPGWMLLLGLADAVILFRLPRALLYAAAILAFVFLGSLFYPGHHLADALYQTATFAVTNVVRHSGACQVGASLTFAGDQVELVVEDDGTGAWASNGDHGFGLSSLAERVQAVGGRLAAGNRSPAGFVLRVELPAGQP